LIKIAEGEGSKATAEHQGLLSKETEKLKGNWGNNFAANKTVAENTMGKLGVTDEQKEALQKTIGYAATMELFRNMGARIGEDKFVTSGSGGGSVMTANEANYRLQALQNDKLWYDKFMAGDVNAKTEFDTLTRLSVSGK
jgi:hypothetical protein